MNSQIIDRIVLLNEKSEELPPNGRVPIEERVIGKRLSYADVVLTAATFPPDVIVAFANADICIDDRSWRNLWDVNMENKFLALLRYDVPASGAVEGATIFGPRADSQDTWILRVADILARGADTIAKTLNFHFGRMGCDNAIALEMLKHKFNVINPCLTMKTWHFHASAVRTYNKQDIVERPILHYIHPSGFHDLKPLLQFPKESVLGQITTSTLHRLVRGTGAASWISSYNKKLKSHESPLKLSNNNTLIPSPEYILKVTNCFQTPSGLVFDKDCMFIGGAQRSQVLWSESATSPMTPTLECERALVAPWPRGGDESREIFTLRYLSKILQLLPTKGWEFFCPEKKEVVEAMETFKWETDKLPVIKHEEDMLVWCKEARVFAPSDNTTILSEDIAALRRCIKGWLPDVNRSRLRIVIVEDGKVLDDPLVRRLEEVLERGFDIRVVYSGRTSVNRMADVLAGAWGVICRGGLEACGWNWILPPGAFVFEVAENIWKAGAPMEGLEISSAAGLEHRFCAPAPAGQDQGDKILEEVFREEETWKAASPVAEAENTPLIIMPRKDLEGFFSHPGDSFREMVRLWERAGYCRIKEHSLATMVWWGSLGKGGVLLYDRDNHDWRLSASLVEKEWKLALFGNPKPPGASASPCVAWTYWPRRPELVEELASAPAAPWSEREPGLVFLGKMENHLQEKRRTTADWKSACTYWSMVKDTEPYPFTQSGYLEKLAKSRFGLCLPGYGFKCHREVECMAMGCVPVCSPGVDMESYAVPPKEGTHYLRASTPEEARNITAGMNETTWSRMSVAAKAWWKDNCSCEGSFKLTKELIEFL
jgi:hypothetical protein